MNTYKFTLAEERDDEKLESICRMFLQEHGVEDVKKNGASLSITFNELILSKHYFEHTLDEYGLLVHKQKKGFLSRFIEKLGKSNSRQFGSKRLDCCDVNKKK